MSEAITLKKISEILDISISTVSRALKDHPDISSRTKQKVKELAETLDYEPNAIAVNLKTKNTRLFVVIVPNLSKYFYDSFISGIEEECQKENYNLMILQNSDNPEIEKANLRLCRNNRVSGVFLCPCTGTNNQNEYLKMIDAEIPLLFFDKIPDLTNFTRVSINDVEAASIAAEHIINKKSKKILALMGNPNISITKRRKSSFQKKLLNTKIKVAFEYAYCTEDAEQISFDFIQEKKCDTIFCMSDEILAGVMLSIQKLKTNIPKDLRIICMSDGFFPKLYNPQVTYVETSGFNLAKLAYEKMKEIIQNPSIHKEEYLLNSTLIVGESI